MKAAVDVEGGIVYCGAHFAEADGSMFITAKRPQTSLTQERLRTMAEEREEAS